MTEYLLTDEQIMQFIAKGYLFLQNDLPEKLHQAVRSKIHRVFHEEGNPGNNILPRVPEIQQFFDTPVVKGALTSVLGPDYYMHPHRHCHYNRPGNDTPGGGKWHKDGYWSSMRSHRPWWAMIFYYTQDITEDMGPTAIMPGTQYYEKHPGDEREMLLPTGRAGTMVLVHFDICHKASLNFSSLDRYMLKFQFTRLQAPEKPSWNYSGGEMPVPEGVAAGAAHLNLWRDVWDWLRGVKTPAQMSDERKADAAYLRRLADELQSEQADVRASAADALGLIGSAAGALAPSLGRLLDDPAEGCALNAAYALGHMGPQGTAELLKQLREGTAAAAGRAAYGIQAAGGEAVPGLMRLLEHPQEQRRALAAFALGMQGSSAAQAVPSLIAALTDESEWVRRNIVESLGMIVQPAERIVPTLAKALEESVSSESDAPNKREDSYVAAQRYIVNKIGYTSALSLLRAGQEGDSGVVVKALEQALNSKDRYVRAYAAEALAHLRTYEAMDVLIRFYRVSRWCPDTHKASTF